MEKMILPRKQLSMSESLFGFGAFLLEQLHDGKTVEELWEYYINAYNNKIYNVKFSFDQYIMALDYLFIIGTIEKDDDGVLRYEAH